MPNTVLAAIAVTGLAVFVSPAWTASNPMPAGSTVGYGSVATTGATVQTIDYTLNTDGTAITAADLVLDGDMTGKTVKAGFGSTASTTCAVGAYNATNTETPATCSGYTQAPSTANTFNVTVVD